MFSVSSRPLSMISKGLTKASTREGETEVTEDTEQQSKCEDILDLVLAAGYFRARIQGLSVFDKVVGGMVWCISNSGVDIDVDIFFEEEATIGQKIKIADSIVKALVAMKCPYRLQSHQIQGSDFISIYPVIQWLVAKVIRTREETGDLLRAFSESQFNKNYKLPQDQERQNQIERVNNYIEEVEERYGARRKFKKSIEEILADPSSNKDVEEIVQNTLLEYGGINLYKVSTLASVGVNVQKNDKRHTMRQSEIGKRISSQIGTGKEDEQQQQQQEEKLRQETENKLKLKLEQMASTTDDLSSVSGSLVGSLVGLQSNQIKEMSQLFAVSPTGAELEGVNKAVYLEEVHKRTVESKKRQIVAQEAKLEEIRKQHEEITSQRSQLQDEFDKKSAMNQRGEQRIQELIELEANQNNEKLQKLKQLIVLNETLKKKEAQFRATCKQQAQEIKEKIQKLKEASAQTEGEESERIKKIEEAYEKDLARMNQLRQLLAKKNREIATVERKIDEIPSRSELQQYQRQFVELYDLVAAKLRETRQYYISYNTLEDTKTFISKEVSILNSIQEQYQVAMSSKANQDKFVESLASIVDSVIKNREKVENRVSTEKKKRDGLQEQFLSLVESERAYHKAAKEFEEECKKNEELRSELED